MAAGEKNYSHHSDINFIEGNMVNHVKAKLKLCDDGAGLCRQGKRAKLT